MCSYSSSNLEAIDWCFFGISNTCRKNNEERTGGYDVCCDFLRDSRCQRHALQSPGEKFAGSKWMLRHSKRYVYTKILYVYRLSGWHTGPYRCVYPFMLWTIHVFGYSHTLQLFIATYLSITFFNTIYFHSRVVCSLELVDFALMYINPATGYDNLNLEKAHAVMEKLLTYTLEISMPFAQMLHTKEISNNRNNRTK